MHKLTPSIDKSNQYSTISTDLSFDACQVLPKRLEAGVPKPCLGGANWCPGSFASLHRTGLLHPDINLTLLQSKRTSKRA